MAKANRNKNYNKSKKPVGDDSMVVFPMSNGKLATTWVQNVESILSEGTGTISIERLETIRAKLSNTLNLIDFRLTELKMSEDEKLARDIKTQLIDFLLSKCVGNVICRYSKYNQEDCDYVLVTKVTAEDDENKTIRIEGITVDKRNIIYWNEKLNTDAVSVSRTKQDDLAFLFSETGVIRSWGYEIFKKNSKTYTSTITEIVNEVKRYSDSLQKFTKLVTPKNKPSRRKPNDKREN